MHRSCEFRDVVGRGLAPILGVACALLLAAAAAEAAECQARPADAFSEKIDSLLGAVEGSGFPAESNLESWPERKGEIQAGFAELLQLADGDAERRKAAVQALLAAQSLAASPDEARLLGTGLERGEVRAWARRVLRTYASLGLTRQDGRYVDAGFITGLQEAWADQEASHADRTLPLYQAKAAELRGLARQASSCE